MKFFIPHTNNANSAERIYQTIKSNVQLSTGWTVTNRRIFRIEYSHNGIPNEAQVGAISTANGEEVMAIFESPPVYFVCTPSRGVTVDPIYVGMHDTSIAEDFES